MINSFFKKRRYFAAIVAVMVLGGVMVGIYIVSTIQKVSQYYLHNQGIQEVVSSINRCTIASKEFLLNSYTSEQFYKTGSSPNIVEFKESYETASQQLEILIKQRSNTDTQAKLNGLVPKLIAFKQVFEQMVMQYKQRGFKDIGIEGEMRKAIHDLEHTSYLPDLKQVLSLRRHEKDFILRKDLAYVQKLHQEIDVMMVTYTQNKALSAEQKAYLIACLQNYGKAFDQIVDKEKMIGLDEHHGLRASIVQKQHELEEQLLFMQQEIAGQTENSMTAVQYIVWVVSFLFLCFLGLVSFVFYIFNNSVRKPVLLLQTAAEIVSQGCLSVDLSDLKKYSLLEDLVLSIERIILKFSNSIETVKSIGQSENITLSAVGNDKDEVGKALNKILLQFQDLRILETRRSWHNEGLAIFAKISREQHTINGFADHAIKALVKYVGVNQAGIFVVNNSNNGQVQLELTAMYAYNRKKFMNQSILAGEGLVGQCYLEKESIYLSDVPQDYVYITSGLGEATPTSIYILACKSRGEIEAVVELASFKLLANYEMEFLEKIGESIAASIYFMRMNEHMKLL